MHVCLTHFIFAPDTEDHILPGGAQAFTLINFSAGIFMCVPVYKENNTQESFVYYWNTKDKYSMWVGSPINLKKSHWQFYKKKIVSLVKRHQGIRKNIQGLKALESFLLLLFSMIVIFIRWFVLATHSVVEFCPLCHVLCVDMNLDLLDPSKNNCIYFRKIKIGNKYIILCTSKYKPFKVSF